MTTVPFFLAAGGSFSPLDFDPAAFLLTLLTFFGLLLVLRKVAWKPILDGLEMREQRIDDAIRKAEQDRHTAGQVLAEYKQTVKNVETEVAALREQGREQAESEGRDIKARAESDATARVERAVREIEMARTQALEDIRREAVNIGMAVASKVVGRSLDGEDQRRLASSVVDGLGGLGQEN